MKIYKKKKVHDVIKGNQILVSSEISPSDLLEYSKIKILGLASVFGGPEGHFAIVARSLSIPTVVGIKNVLKKLKDNENIIIDGDKGLLIKNPTNETIISYKKKIEEKKMKNKNLEHS